MPMPPFKPLQTLLVLALVAVSGMARAEPLFARLYQQQYGYTPSCNACHRDGGGSELNPYGDDFKAAGSGLAAFAPIAAKDSDGDGLGNATEAKARANPGDRRSTPAKPGDWLDTANLIPREVQRVFPGVTSYKPMDTLLTPAEIERAAALGVALDENDENTIYVAVAEGRAVGTAIIVPVTRGEAQFFVLLATDRQLKVTHAQPVHAGKVAGADDPAPYAQVIGLDVEALPKGKLDGEVDEAVLAGLKKAGTLLLVRLKKA